MHLTSGGPYVPTPLVYPHLLVPGDNGRMLFYRRRRRARRGRPGPRPLHLLAGRGRRQDLLVLGARQDLRDRRRPARPATKADGQGAGRQSASRDVPGNAGDRPRPAVHPHQRGPVLHRRQRDGRGSHDRVKGLCRHVRRAEGRYEKHQADWQNEPEAQIRLETLEAIARLDDPQVIPFLLHTAQKEPHWDICEEAAKSLGRKGPPAVDSLIVLLPDSRPFIRTIAINELGRLKADQGGPGPADRRARQAAAGSQCEPASPGSNRAGRRRPILPRSSRAMTAAVDDVQQEEAVVRGIGD